MKQMFAALCLGAFLTSPMVVQARDDDHPKKYYDREHKDYHEWNSNEDTNWHRYREEKHLKDRDWNKSNRREQQEYWNWRHQHQDNH